jgi:glutamate/tyrosine decarboxylase-like PLP-dependent enzyme
MPLRDVDPALPPRLAPLAAGLEAVAAWQRGFGGFEPAPALDVPDDRVAGILSTLADRLTDNYPFHHPRYAGQMLKPPHPVAMMAYMMAMQINPNNHALDGGPATAELERETIAAIAGMVGFDAPLGHLSASGTIANLEALWVARCLNTDGAIAYSRQAHYTHSRMGEVLGMRTVPIEVDDRGRMDLDALKTALETERIGTIVATLGTTGVGALDPLDAILPLARAHGVRVHVDAAYGGFYRLLADQGVEGAPYRAVAEADSFVVDPHKHGLQPYGCGAVLFRDATVGRFYKHDSPYTYFTSKALHLGEISLECSRAGASAAAFWATLQAFPLSAEGGLGAVLASTRRAALAWADLIEASDALHLVLPPQLDILAYFPTTEGLSASAVSRASDRVFEQLMNDPEDPVYLAKLTLPKAIVAPRAPGLAWDQETITVLRSCLLKPEHEAAVPWLHARVEGAARGA